MRVDVTSDPSNDENIGQTIADRRRQGKEEIGITVDAKGKLIGKHSEKNEKHEK